MRSRGVGAGRAAEFREGEGGEEQRGAAWGWGECRSDEGRRRVRKRGVDVDGGDLWR